VNARIVRHLYPRSDSNLTELPDVEAEEHHRDGSGLHKLTHHPTIMYTDGEVVSL
jgi:hypothetical protein